MLLTLESFNTDMSSDSIKPKIDPRANSVLGNTEAVRGDIQDALTRLLNVVDNTAGSEGQSLTANIDGEMMNVQVIQLEDGSTQKIAVQTIDSRAKQIAAEIKKQIAQASESLDDETQAYKQELLNKIDSLLSKKQKIDIDNLETKIDINADNFDDSILALEKSLESTFGSLNTFDDNLTLDKLSYQTLSILADPSKSYGASLADSKEVGQVQKINDTRSLFDILYGANGFDNSNINTADEAQLFIEGGLDDRSQFIGDLVKGKLKNGVNSLIATEMLVAGNVNASFQTRKLSEKQQTSSEIIPPQISSFTTSALIMKSLSQKLIDKVDSTFNDQGDNSLSELLAWKKEKVQINIDGKVQAIEVHIPQGELARQLFMPIPVKKDLSINEQKAFMKFSQEEYVANKNVLNSSINDFNKNLDSTLNSMQVAIQSKIDSFLGTNSELSTAKEEYLTAKELYNTNKFELDAKQSELKNLQTQIDNLEQENSDLIQEQIKAQSKLDSLLSKETDEDITAEVAELAAQISSLTGQISVNNDSITAKISSKISASNSIAQLEASQEGLKLDYKNKLVNFSDVTTSQIDTSLKANVSKTVEAKLDTNLSGLKESYKKDITATANLVETTLTPKIQELFNGKDQVQSDADKDEIRRLILLMFFFSFIESSEWDENLNTAHNA